MIVTINEDYQVKVDNYANYALIKDVRDESGVITMFATKGYYSNMSRALNACIHLMLEDKYDVMELTQYLDELERLEAKFRPVMKRFREGDQMTKSEVTELQNFIVDEVLPTYADGYEKGEIISKIIIGTLKLRNKYILKPTKLGATILANQLKFRAMVEAELEELAEKVEDEQ